VHRLSRERYPHLLLSAGACSMAPPAVDVYYLLHAGHSAANPLLLLIDGTDGLMPDRS